MLGCSSGSHSSSSFGYTTSWRNRPCGGAPIGATLLFFPSSMSLRSSAVNLPSLVAASIIAPTMFRTMRYKKPLPSTSSRINPSGCSTTSNLKIVRVGLRTTVLSRDLFENEVKSCVPTNTPAASRSFSTSGGFHPQCSAWRLTNGSSTSRGSRK